MEEARSSRQLARIDGAQTDLAALQEEVRRVARNTERTEPHADGSAPDAGSGRSTDPSSMFAAGDLRLRIGDTAAARRIYAGAGSGRVVELRLAICDWADGDLAGAARRCAVGILRAPGDPGFSALAGMLDPIVGRNSPKLEGPAPRE